jgi:outer membrane protein OmpA-like peptidoglycan-associated protein
MNPINAQRVGVWCGLIALVLLTACGPKSMVVLVPDPDGSVGRITVSNAAGSVEIDQANQATVVRDDRKAPAAPTALDPGEIEATFAAVLANQPPPPVRYRLYFLSDAVDLQAQSRQQLPEIVAMITRRLPTRVSVVGHSDTQGDKVYNLELSMRRAKAVKQLLVEQGIEEKFIDVSSHGEENLLVKTGDNVANAMNRRVEVIVR